MTKRFLSTVALGAVAFSLNANAALPVEYTRALDGASSDAKRCADLSYKFAQRTPALLEEIRQYAAEKCPGSPLVGDAQSFYNAAGFSSYQHSDSELFVVSDVDGDGANAVPQNIVRSLQQVAADDQQCAARAAEYARANPTMAHALYRELRNLCGTSAARSLATSLIAQDSERYAIVPLTAQAQQQAAGDDGLVTYDNTPNTVLIVLDGGATGQTRLPAEMRAALQSKADSASGCADQALAFAADDESLAHALYKEVRATCGQGAAAKMASGLGALYPQAFIVADSSSYAATGEAKQVLSSIQARRIKAASTNAEQCTSTTLQIAQNNPDMAEAAAQYASATCGTVVDAGLASGLARLYPQSFDGSSLIASQPVEAAPLTSDQRQARIEAEVERATAAYGLTRAEVLEIQRTRADSDECVDSVLDLSDVNKGNTTGIATYAMEVCNTEEVTGPIAVGLATMYPDLVVDVAVAMSKAEPALYAEIVLGALSVFPGEQQQGIFDTMIAALQAEIPELAAEQEGGFSALDVLAPPGDAVVLAQQTDPAGLEHLSEIPEPQPRFIAPVPPAPENPVSPN